MPAVPPGSRSLDLQGHDGQGEGLGDRSPHAVGGREGDREATRRRRGARERSVPVKVTPAGRAPDSVTAAAGSPRWWSQKLEDWPSTKVADPGEVMAGGWSTVRVKD